MKKIVAVCLCLTLIVSLAVLPTSAATSLHDAFANDLVHFETYKNDCKERPNGHIVSIMLEVIEEALYWEYATGETYEDPYITISKENFETYANKAFSISDAQWTEIRAAKFQRYTYDEATGTDSIVFYNYYNADDGTYNLPLSGGYGGATPLVEYCGYVKNGNAYDVYLEILNFSDEKPAGKEGVDYRTEEIMGDIYYILPPVAYMKHRVGYQDSIVKKISCTKVTALPANLITKAGETATTKAPTTTTTTTITTTTTTTSTTLPVQDLPIIAVETENIVIKTAQDAFPKDTVVEVEVITEGETLTTVQTALEDVAEKFVVFEITAQSKNVAVQPNGTVRATFTVPDGYNPNLLAVYYVAPNGQKEEIPSTVDTATGTIVAELSHFSTYVLAEKTASSIVETDTDVPPADPQGTFPWTTVVIVAIVAVAVLLVGIAVWYFVFFAKKKQ